MPTLTKVQVFRLFCMFVVSGILIKVIDWPWMQEMFGLAPMWIIVSLLILLAIVTLAIFVLSIIASRI